MAAAPPKAPEKDGALVTPNGARVARLAVDYRLFIDRTTVIYGPSGSGKTFIVRNILGLLEPHIDQGFVISPTAATNGAYTDYVRAPLIHYRMYLPDPAGPRKNDEVKGTLRFLEALWNRAEMMAAIHARANQPDALGRLFRRLPEDARRPALRRIEAMAQRRRLIDARLKERFRGEPGPLAEKAKSVEAKFLQCLCRVYKAAIAAHVGALRALEDLDQDERYCLTYVAFNPRLLLIFDDCAADLKPYFRRDVFRKLFYQNRWAFITVVLCCQDDTDLDANLRKNAYVSFFTNAQVCSSNFERAANKYSRETRELVADALGAVFSREAKNRKFVYIREDPEGVHFYHVTFPYPRRFCFGSRALKELCDKVEASGRIMDRSNPYYAMFSLDA